MEATSVQLRLGDSFFPPTMESADNSTTTSNSADNFLEEKFKAQLAWHFKINQVIRGGNGNEMIKRWSDQQKACLTIIVGTKRTV